MSSDLFSGQNALQPWLQRTIHQHLLDTLENQQSAACGAIKEQEVLRRSKKSKPIQILDLMIAGDDRDGDTSSSSSSSSSSYLLISDGANSIVAELLPQQQQEQQDSPQQRQRSDLTRGCMVRMEDWEVHVEPRFRPRSRSTAASTQNNELLFQQHAVSHHGNTAVYLKVFGNVVKMGDRDITGRPEPVIQDTDVQRVLIAMMADSKTTTTTTAPAPPLRHQQEELPGAGADRDVLPFGPINGVFVQEEGFSSGPDGPATLCGDAADSRPAISDSSNFGADLPPPPPPAEEITSQETAAPGLIEKNQQSEDLPIGDFSVDLSAGNHAVWDSCCEEALKTKSNALPLVSSDDDGHHPHHQRQQLSEQMKRSSNELQASSPQRTALEERQSRDMEKKPQSPLESSVTEVLAKEQLAPASNAHFKRSNRTTDIQSSTEQSYGEDEDEEEDQGIGNMLIDPTQKDDASQESAQAMSYDENKSRDKSRRPEYENSGADRGSEPQTSVLQNTQKPDSEPSDGDEAKGEDFLETQPLDMHVNSQQTAGEASNERTSQLQNRGIDFELISTATKPYSERKAKRKKPGPDAAVSTSFFSNADRLFCLIDSAENSEKPALPAAKRTKGFRFGGDSLRAFLE